MRIFMQSLCKKRRGLELSAEPSVPPVNTVPPGGQIIMESLWEKEAGLRAESWSLYSASQHSTTWWLCIYAKLVRKGEGLWDQRGTLCGTTGCFQWGIMIKTTTTCMLCFPTFHRAVDFVPRSIVSICKQRLKGEWSFSLTDQEQLFLEIER